MHNSKRILGIEWSVIAVGLAWAGVATRGLVGVVFSARAWVTRIAGAWSAARRAAARRGTR